jgi:hypothetical protein
VAGTVLEKCVLPARAVAPGLAYKLQVAVEAAKASLRAQELGNLTLESRFGWSFGPQTALGTAVLAGRQSPSSIGSDLPTAPGHRAFATTAAASGKHQCAGGEQTERPRIRRMPSLLSVPMFPPAYS